MCGIAGYFGPGELDVPRMIASLRHRGPDGAGDWSVALPQGTRLQLLHTRLSILDLSDAGAQPMALVTDATNERRAESRERRAENTTRWRVAGPRELAAFTGETSNSPLPDSTAGTAAVVLSYNGEIYNYRELRAELTALGHTFRSSGDSEVLLRGYAEWGPGLFARLDGMFALAIFDAAQRRLVVARDHAGIKPLYHTRTRDGGLLVASEVRTIAASGLASSEVDRDGVADFLRFGSLQEPRTLWQGVQAFPPGHWGWLALDAGAHVALTIEPYWLPERCAAEAGVADAAARAAHDAMLAQTVGEQLASDVPLGVYLSGGIDSTLLMELAAKRGGRERITAFTLAGAATEADEARIAEATAKHAQVRHVEVALSAAELERWVRDGLHAMDQPSSDGINTYLVSRASRGAGLVVALSGTGADELHGAYGHARSLRRLIRGWRAAGPLCGLGIAAGAQVLRARQGSVAAERWRSLMAAAPSPWKMDFERRRFFTTMQADAYWPEGRKHVALPPGPFVDVAAFERGGISEQVRLAELRGYLLNTLLRDADWATMANQQELRVPFLGRRYMESVLRVPEEATEPRNGVKKPWLTALLSAEAQHLTAQPKRGFLLNYVDLLLGPLRADFEHASATLNQRLGFALETEVLLGELARERSGKFSRRLWALLALGSALR